MDGHCHLVAREVIVLMKVAMTKAMTITNTMKITNTMTITKHYNDKDDDNENYKGKGNENDNTYFRCGRDPYAVIEVYLLSLLYLCLSLDIDPFKCLGGELSTTNPNYGRHSLSEI